MRQVKLVARLVAALSIAAIAPLVTPAQAASDNFYAGKTVRLLIGYPPGTAFEIYGRALIRHMARHLPGEPTMIIQNMPGAGSLSMTGYLANVAPKDGTVIAMPNPMNTTEPLIDPEKARFDPRKFAWIGSINAERSTCGFWADDVKTLPDLKGRELIIAASGPSAGSTIDAKALRNLLGFNFRIVAGYPGLAEMQLAAQRGEAHGYCGVLVSMLKSIYWDDYRKGTFKIPLQMGLEKHPDLPDVPNAYDLVESEENRQVFKLIFAPWSYGRPIAAPPDTAPALVAQLRAAFRNTMGDGEFLAEAKKLNLEINPIAGDEIAKLVSDLYQTPPAVIERTRQILAVK